MDNSTIPSEVNVVTLHDTQSQVPARLLPLLDGERRALDLLGARKPIELAASHLEMDDPNRAATWGEDRQLRSRFLEWLLTESDLCAELPSNRLEIRGAKVLGALNLSFRSISTYLVFRQCSMSDGLQFSSSRFRGLELGHVAVGAINAWSALVEGPVILERLSLLGVLHLANAKIVGDFSIRHSGIDAGGVTAINAPNLAVQGNFFLEDSRLVGRINLINASFSGDLVLNGGLVDPQSNLAINADGMTVLGRCFMRNGMDIRGTVRLMGAKINGEFNLNSARIVQDGEFAVDARNSRIIGAVYLTNGFLAEGRVGFSGAEIGGELSLSGGTIIHPNDTALDARACKVKGSVNLSTGLVNGAIFFYGMTIEGDLNCAGTKISEAPQPALNVRRARIQGSVYLTEGFTADRLVTFSGTSIGGDVVLSKVQIETPDQALEFNAIKATTVRIEDASIRGTVDLFGAELAGDLILQRSAIISDRRRALNLDTMRARTFVLEARTRVRGPISMYGATLSGDLVVRDATLEPNNTRDILFNARSLRCNGVLNWHDLSDPPLGVVSFEQAHVGGLYDKLESWPSMLRLDGFTYDRLVGDAPIAVNKRLDWLSRQDRYYSQPFEHLIAMYRKIGDSARAADVAICKWRTRRSEMPRRSLGRIWDWFLDMSSGYGYRPWRPLLGLFLVLVVGTTVYSWGEHKNVFCEVDTLKNDPPCVTKPHFPPFNPFAYSIEALVPLGDFGQRRLYVLRGDVPASNLVSAYTIVHRAFGWIFSLLLALAPTNILRRE